MATTANPRPNITTPIAALTARSEVAGNRSTSAANANATSAATTFSERPCRSTQRAPQRSKPHNPEHRTHHGPRRAGHLGLEDDERYSRGGKGDRASPDSEPSRFPTQAPPVHDGKQQQGNPHEQAQTIR